MIYLVIVCFIIIFGLWGSMAALWRKHRKMMKFGTLVVMAMNSNLTNCGVSRTNSLTPPPVEKTQHWNDNNSWTPCSRKIKLSTHDYSLHADSIQCFTLRLLPLQVTAILNSTVFCFFTTKFPKLAQMIFGQSWTELAYQIFLLSLFKSYDVVNDKVDPKLVRIL